MKITELFIISLISNIICLINLNSFKLIDINYISIIILLTIILAILLLINEFLDK
jgi:hypothetical protein